MTVTPVCRAACVRRRGLQRCAARLAVRQGSLTPQNCPLGAVQAVAAQLKRLYNCCPVFLEKELKEKYYKGGCQGLQ